MTTSFRQHLPRRWAYSSAYPLTRGFSLTFALGSTFPVVVLINLFIIRIMPNSFEGELARVFAQEDVFVTTPNATYIPDDLLLGPRDVRLRNNCYFGQDDPLLHPQFFNPRVPHLCCITQPVLDPTTDEYWVFWYTPELPDDFETDSESTAQNVGQIRKCWRERLFDAAHKLLRSVRDELSKSENKRLATDRVLTTLGNRLRYFMKRLDLVASFVEAVSTFRHTCRIALELRARMTWLTSVRHNYYDSTPTQDRAEALCVVGALTLDLTVAENLHRCRIPFWLIRPLNRKAGVASTVWLDATVPPPRPRWITATEWDDAQPAHRTIFRGDACNLDRYRAMHDFIDSQMSSYASSVLARPLPAHAATSPSSPATASSSSSSQNVGVHRTDKQRRSSPYAPTSGRSPQLPPKPSKNSPQKQSQPHRDKFVDVASQLLPPAIPTWAAAMKQVGRKQIVHQSREPWRGAHTGYCLPDPNAIVSPRDEETVAGQLRSLCKLWNILLYRVTSHQFDVLIPKQWRSLLTLDTHTSTTPGTKAAQNREDMQALVNKCLQAGMKEGGLDMFNWKTQPVKWHNRRVKLFKPDYPLAPVVVRPILWELAEINFRWEVVSLDSILYTLKMERALNVDEEELGERDDWEEFDATTRLDREAAILSTALAYCGGSIVPNEVQEHNIGFASSDLHERHLAVRGLFFIMKGWSLSIKSMPRDTREAGNRLDKVLNEGRLLSGLDMDHTEYLIALWYVDCFATVFNRAPIMPRRRFT
ncbi:hypothetical protein BDZ89DRAFT_1139715 [Hymenopellis radicata]|nr:hypothetical protein BDZ89DRAFT_1139715 [Hymenopellis radicata]